MIPSVVSIDGRLCAPESAAISVFDGGFLHGDGVFTVLRGAGGVAVDLPGHLERLAADASQLELTMPPVEQLRASIDAVLDAFGPSAARLRIVLTRGRGSSQQRWSERTRGRVLVIAEAAAPPRTEARVTVVEEPRLASSATWAAKSLSYQAALWARERAARLGADEALRLFADDTVGEGAASNLFLVRAGRLATPPPMGIRPGVTRRRVLELCDAFGIIAIERPIARSELTFADELFITSAISGVVPVVALDGRAIARGPLAASLSARYEELAGG